MTRVLTNNIHSGGRKVAQAVGMALGALFFAIIILINVLLHHFSRKKLSNLSGSEYAFLTIFRLSL